MFFSLTWKLTCAADLLCHVPVKYSCIHLNLKIPVPPTRYKILCAHLIKEPIEPQKAAQIILDNISIDSEQYRMGHTKVDMYTLSYSRNRVLLVFKIVCKISVNVINMHTGCIRILNEVYKMANSCQSVF